MNISLERVKYLITPIVLNYVGETKNLPKEKEEDFAYR